MSDSPYHLPSPQLHWRDGQPHSERFDDVYFSRDSGAEETRHVFLEGNELPRRLRALPRSRPGVFCIGETGFGTGLNLLSAWQLWREHAPENWRLHLFSTELYPLTRAQLHQALADRPELDELAQILLRAYPPRLPGLHWRWLEPGRVSLGLWLGDARAGLEALRDSADPTLNSTMPRVDAWFLDGFAPARNPELWRAPVYELLRQWSAPGASFATFTAAGEVRRGLTAAGFAVEKFPGFGRKREMLRGRLRAQAPPAKTTVDAAPVEYWGAPGAASVGRRAVVVGAGLAGCATALALARRGWRVEVVEQAGRIAAGASGNPQAVLYTRFSARPNPVSDFALSSYSFALNHYRQLAGAGALAPAEYDFCGVLQLPTDPAQTRQQEEIATALADHPELVQLLDRDRARERAGIDLPRGGLWLPEAGWLSPAAVCRAQLDHPAITLHLDSTVITLRRGATDWRVKLAHGEALEADVVVACSGLAQDWLQPWARLPLRAVRGQISHIRTQAAPSCVLCHEGYVTAAVTGGLWIGATFDPLPDPLSDPLPALRTGHTGDDLDLEPRTTDHARNIDSLNRALPTLAVTMDDADAGRVGLRAATPDYLPLAGAVPAQPQFRRCFAALATNARQPVREPPPLVPGLFLNAGHGSRGLTSTPLCAELVAALASGDSRPLTRDLRQRLNPARFAARALIRGPSTGPRGRYTQ